MNREFEDRRNFLKSAAVLGAAGAGGVSGCAQMPTSGNAMKNSYDPFARYEVVVSETEFRRTAKGRQLMARIYRPQGTGPFPVVLVVHENRGLNPHIEDVVRRAAVAGYLAIGPDVLTSLGGYPGTDEAGAVMKAIIRIWAPQKEQVSGQSSEMRASSIAHR